MSSPFDVKAAESYLLFHGTCFPNDKFVPEGLLTQLNRAQTLHLSALPPFSLALTFPSTSALLHRSHILPST